MSDEAWANAATILGVIVWVLPETRWRAVWMRPATGAEFIALLVVSSYGALTALTNGWLPSAAGCATLAVWAIVQWWRKRPPRQRKPSKVAGRVRVSLNRAGLEVAPTS
jgi:hypothetical protein